MADLDAPQGSRAIKGIYKVEGDKLFWCFPMQGPGDKDAPRPTAFDSKQGMLLVLRRAGADEAKAPAPPPPSPMGDRPGDTNLKVIALALQNNHDSFGKYPAAIYDPAGKPLLSWRVAILPFIEQIELYQKFDLTKPWDDPHNKKLSAEMPRSFSSCRDRKRQDRQDPLSRTHGAKAPCSSCGRPRTARPIPARCCRS